MEMYRTFNMGIGMVLAVHPKDVDATQKVNPEACVIGEIIESDEESKGVEFV